MASRRSEDVENDSTNRAGTSATTRASEATRKLLQALAAGEFRPGERLRMDALCKLLGAGSSPVREALNRLAAQGLIDQYDQRGFWVPPVSLADLEELTNTRCWINEIAVRESIKKGDAVWEERIVVALHRLNQAARLRDEGEQGAPAEWERRHREFHRALISGCGSRLLIDFAETLLDRAARYRYLAVSVTGHSRNVAGEHSEIAEAALARDAERTISLLTAHLMRTMRLAGAFANAGQAATAKRRGRNSPPHQSAADPRP